MTYSKRSIVTGSNLIPDFIGLMLSISLIGMLSISTAIASSNNVSTMCSAGDIYMDPIPLPVSSNENTNSGANKLDTTACGLAASILTDGVKCFIPENSCNIALTGRGSAINGDSATRVAIAAGTCSDTPASCTGSGTTNTITSFAVTAGTQYCFYVETTIAQQIGYTLASADGSDCGSMPVQLLHFSIE